MSIEMPLQGAKELAAANLFENHDRGRQRDGIACGGALTPRRANQAHQS
jgi:hypothetical protein